jgi:hypothetical protein
MLQGVGQSEIGSRPEWDQGKTGRNSFNLDDTPSTGIQSFSFQALFSASVANTFKKKHSLRSQKQPLRGNSF